MLTRVKTFVATGVATAGRLYAGDLNAIQDAAAAQADFAQTIDLATLRIGETGLQLLHYGTGEARLSGLLRVDQIVRALGGIYAGQFTTTQRDAITAGSRPYGLVIWNTTTSRLEANQGSDATPNWQSIGSVAVKKNGSQVGVRQTVNFIEGSGVTLTMVDNSGSGQVDVTIAAPSSPSAGIVPIGGAILYGGNSDPTNFLLCDGRSLVRTTPYDGLFAQIGTNYGNVDGTHFNIPDLRGRVPVGPNAKVVLAANEGLAVGNRNVKHFHQLTAPNDPHGGFTSGGAAPAAMVADTTTGDQLNLDTPAYLGINFAIRYQ